MVIVRDIFNSIERIVALGKFLGFVTWDYGTMNGMSPVHLLPFFSGHFGWLWIKHHIGKGLEHPLTLKIVTN